MKQVGKAVYLVWFMLAFIGCGGKANLQQVSAGNSCDGVLISGILHDSLTFQPVTRGMAILESGTVSNPSSIINFFPIGSVSTDAQGAFSLCASSTISYPSVVVLEAMDTNGKAYPPYVKDVSASTDLGVISMGGCTLLCGLANEQQTATPATVSGIVTSTPISLAGTVIPQFSMLALDGSKTTSGSSNLWNLAMPMFISSPTLTFSTLSGTCVGNAPFCSNFSFAVPAQSPIHPSSGGTMQQAASPSYSIYVKPDNASACTPSFSFTAFQADGKSALTATEGAQLVTQTINLTNCH